MTVHVLTPVFDFDPNSLWKCYILRRIAMRQNPLSRSNMLVFIDEPLVNFRKIWHVFFIGYWTVKNLVLGSFSDATVAHDHFFCVNFCFVLAFFGLGAWRLFLIWRTFVSFLGRTERLNFYNLSLLFQKSVLDEFYLQFWVKLFFFMFCRCTLPTNK
jgi:hypothetical protein